MHVMILYFPHNDGYRENIHRPCWIDSPLNRIFINTDPNKIRTDLKYEEGNLRLLNVFHEHKPADFDQIFGLVELDINRTVESVRATTLQFRMRGDQNFSKIVEAWEDMFVSWSKQHRNDSLDISVFTSDT